MKTQKEIGSVFKERLDKLDNSPDDVVWNNINSELQKENKRRWLKILLFSLFSLTCFYLVSKRLYSLKKNTISKEVLMQEKDSTSILSIKTSSETKEFTIVNRPNKNSKKSALNYPKENTKKDKGYKQKIKINKLNEKLSITLNKKGYHSYTPYFSDEIIIKKTSEENNDDLLNEWSVSIVNGVNYLNTNIENTSLNANTSKNSKENSFNYSFGFYINYRFNKTMMFRFGLHKLTMNFNTPNIANNNTEISSILTPNDVIPELINEDFISLFNNDSNINIREEINYLEIPIELKYSFLKKVPDLNLITGFSYLHLTNNTIYGHSKNTKELKIGSSSSISKSSFSFNIGINKDFNLGQNLTLNLTLNHKQYFNIFQYNKFNLNTRIINLQTGLTYKF